MSLSTLARSSLKQYAIIYSEVRAEHGDVQGDQLEALMWEKIVGGTPTRGNKIPSSCLKKIKHPLPYMPDIINYLGCPALKPVSGLYIPCGNKQTDGEQFCPTCAKNSAKFGTLADRGAPGSYTDPNDKHEITYGTWLAKNEVTIEEVHRDIADQGFTFQIPDSYLTVNARRATAPKRRPGRPGVVKKTVVNEDGTESPMGTSMDGVDVKVVLSDATISSDEEDEDLAEEPIKKPEKKTEKAEKPEKAEKQEKAEKPKKEKAEKAEKVEKPKKEKPEKAEKAEKVEKPKKEKAEKPENGEKKKRPPPSKPKSPHLQPEEEEEEIMVDGESFVRRGKNIFDSDGTFRGVLNNKKIEWITTSP